VGLLQHYQALLSGHLCLPPLFAHPEVLSSSQV
jgi:hypothetical protein